MIGSCPDTKHNNECASTRGDQLQNTAHVADDTATYVLKLLGGLRFRLCGVSGDGGGEGGSPYS